MFEGVLVCDYIVVVCLYISLEAELYSLALIRETTQFVEKLMNRCLVDVELFELHRLNVVVITPML
jgi:hypothetical protein